MKQTLSRATPAQWWHKNRVSCLVLAAALVLFIVVRAIAVPEEPQNRVVAASAADELLNISGVDASIVVAPDGNGGSFASARSIGELNVQLIMEKVGGGGNRSAAAAQFAGIDVNTAVKRIYAAIDDYLG